MSRKLAFGLSVLVLVGALSGASFANVIQVTLGQSTSGVAWAGSTGASLTGVSGYAYQGGNAGTYTFSDIALTGAGCNLVCVLSGSPATVTVQIGADTLVGTLTFTAEALGKFLDGKFLITSSTPGFASTGYAVGQTVGADISIVNAAISSGQIQTDAVPEPGTIAMVGSGLLAVAGVLRRKLF